MLGSSSRHPWSFELFRAFSSEGLQIVGAQEQRLVHLSCLHCTSNRTDTLDWGLL